MSIQVSLNHRTEYRYDRPVSLTPHIVRLRPAPHCRTAILAYSLKISPENHFINWQQDPQSNYIARVVFPEKTRKLTIEVDLLADLTVINPFDFFLEPVAEKFPFRYPKWLDRELSPFLEIEEASPLLDAFLAGIDRASRPTVNFLVELN
jgi:transglutaminase-like putative cysteine protease